MLCNEFGFNRWGSLPLTCPGLPWETALFPQLV
jgi:hypothetical protein